MKTKTAKEYLEDIGELDFPLARANMRLSELMERYAKPYKDKAKDEEYVAKELGESNILLCDQLKSLQEQSTQQVQAALKEEREKICNEHGCNMFKVTEHDTGRSYLTLHKCSRCGKTDENQFDYQI